MKLRYVIFFIFLSLSNLCRCETVLDTMIRDIINSKSHQRVGSVVSGSHTINKKNKDWIEKNLQHVLDMLGYDIEQEKKDIEEVDKEEIVENIVDDKKNKYLNSISWEKYCPPIGHQGDYGTCVAWAVAYNLKTTLNMIDVQFESVEDQKYICSPVDLWFLIKNYNKGRVCNGTSIKCALEAICRYGVASLSIMPCSRLNRYNCDSGKGIGNRNNKISYYSLIACSNEVGMSSYGMTVENIKYYLNKAPLAIGAKLGERFMNWNSDAILRNDTKTYKGKHARHAMLLVGYDDDKRAFRIRNSWGTGWGDNGSIWVDYDYFINQFCTSVWRANN